MKKNGELYWIGPKIPGVECLSENGVFAFPLKKQSKDQWDDFLLEVDTSQSRKGGRREGNETTMRGGGGVGRIGGEGGGGGEKIGGRHATIEWRVERKEEGKKSSKCVAFGKVLPEMAGIEECLNDLLWRLGLGGGLSETIFGGMWKDGRILAIQLSEPIFGEPLEEVLKREYVLAGIGRSRTWISELTKFYLTSCESLIDTARR